MRSRQSEKERDTTRPLVQVMSLRNLHQGERCQPSPSTARMRVTPESEEVGVEVGQEGSLGDGGDDHDGEDGDGDGDEEDDGKESYEGASVGPEDNRPFILFAE